MNRFWRIIRSFLVALTVTALMIPVRRYIIVGLLDLPAPFFPYLVAVALATRIAGLWSGYMATGLGTLVVGYVLSASENFDPDPPHLVIRVGVFAAVCAFTTHMIAALTAARRRVSWRQQQLEHEVAERRRAELAEREQREQLAVEVERRMAAELAVREREERMRMAVESTDIGTWDFNPVTGERNWSERAKAMFGLEPGTDVTNVSYLDRIHPEDQDRARAAVERALDPASDGRYEIECRLLLTGDEVRWFVVKGQAFFAGEGAARHPIRFIGTVMEITERKKTEQALRKAEELFRKLATFAPVGIFHTDEIGRCLFVNDAWCEITGAQPEQAIGTGWAQFVHAEDRQRVVDEWHESARTRSTDSTEFRFDNRTKGVRLVTASAIPLQDGTGRVTGFVGTIVDLTDRKVVEDVIRADEARLRSILDNTPAVISLKDLAGRYVLVNRGWEALYGVTNEQILGRTNYDLLRMTSSSHMSPIIADQFRDLDRRVIETAGPIEFEDPLPDGDDQIVFSTVKFPITDDLGRIIGVGGITTDITERRRALDSLKAEQDILRRTIEVRDRERQLIAYEIHDGLVQDVAGALMQVESLRFEQNGHPSAAGLQRVESILRRAVDEGRRLINDIRTPVLDGLGVVAALEHLIHEEDRVQVPVEFVKDQDFDRMDPKIEEAVYRITQEALTNVGKHSHSPTARVALARQGDRLHLEVRDWGVGFSPAKAPRSSHGLRSMTERARIAGGQCTIRSAPGEGTQVVVELPIVLRN